jgi:hypothetical protein
MGRYIRFKANGFTTIALCSDIKIATTVVRIAFRLTQVKNFRIHYRLFARWIQKLYLLSHGIDAMEAVGGGTFEILASSAKHLSDSNGAWLDRAVTMIASTGTHCAIIGDISRPPTGHEVVPR